MAIKKYYDSDCNLGVLDGKTVAVIGFGSQGHAHSENLAESGVNVVVGLRKGSAHWEKASEFAATHENFKVMEVEEAAKAGDVVMMLVPDELCADIYNKQVAPYMTEGKALAFAHGFNIHFKTITPPKNVDVIMIAPKGPGHTVRSTYVNGKGVPCLIAVEQNASGNAYKIGLAYAAGIGGARGGEGLPAGGADQRPVLRAGDQRHLAADDGGNRLERRHLRFEGVDVGDADGRAHACDLAGIGAEVAAQKRSGLLQLGKAGRLGHARAL